VDDLFFLFVVVFVQYGFCGILDEWHDRGRTLSAHGDGAYGLCDFGCGDGYYYYFDACGRGVYSMQRGGGVDFVLMVDIDLETAFACSPQVCRSGCVWAGCYVSFIGVCEVFDIV
jgi:hypothetical protein